MNSKRHWKGMGIDMKVRKTIYRALYGIFIFAFALVLGKVLFGDAVHGHNTITLLFYTLLGAGIMFLARHLLAKYQPLVERYDRAILIAFLVLYGILLLVNGFALRFTPAFDMDAVYGGAVQWVREGSFSNYYEYYGYFPNNLGAMTVLHAVFSLASLFGISDFFAVGILFNSLLIVATVLVVFLICKKLRGSVGGVLSLLFFLLCVPFSFMGAAFYTDSLSLLFPVLFYYLYLHYKEQETWKMRLVYAAAMAAALTLGMMIKFTVLIVLVAVLIDGLLCLHWKKVCLFAGCSIILAVAVFGIRDAVLYHGHLDREQSRELKTPYLHWVMMGMQNNGYYNPEDYEYTRSFSSEERSEACLRKAKERVRDMGIGGLTELFMNKILVCFGDGTYALSDFLDDSPDKESWLHKYILYEGEKYSSYQHFATGMLLMVYFFMLAGAVDCLVGRADDGEWEILAPRLACLGILSFLMLWETSGRYFTNFVPMMLVCGVLAFGKGSGYFGDGAKQKREK